MAVVQAALLGLTAVLLAAQLKPLRPEYAVYLVLAASIGVGFLGLARLGVLLDTLREIGNGIQIFLLHITLYEVSLKLRSLNGFRHLIPGNRLPETFFIAVHKKRLIAKQ